MREPQPADLGNTLANTRHGTHLPRQADLAKHREFTRQRLILRGRCQRHHAR